MVSCADIDWISFLESQEMDEEVRKHISECPDCQERKQICVQLFEVLSALFQKGLQDECSCLEETIAYTLSEKEASEMEIKNHILSCPVCLQAYLLIQDFEASFAEERSYVALPESIKERLQVYQGKTAANRMKSALEKLYQGKEKSRAWIDRVVQGALTEKKPKIVPASRDDLTKSSSERSQDDSSDTSKDKDGDEPSK